VACDPSADLVVGRAVQRGATRRARPNVLVTEKRLGGLEALPTADQHVAGCNLRCHGVADKLSTLVEAGWHPPVGGPRISRPGFGPTTRAVGVLSTKRFTRPTTCATHFAVTWWLPILPRRRILQSANCMARREVEAQTLPQYQGARAPSDPCVRNDQPGRRDRRYGSAPLTEGELKRGL
jgi:hypothetical protein